MLTKLSTWATAGHISVSVFPHANATSLLGICTACVWSAWERVTQSPRGGGSALLLSSSEEVDVKSVDDESHPQSPQYEELMEVVTRAVAKLNISWPAEKQAELQKSKLDGPPKRGLPASKQTLSRWIVDAITIAYESSGLPSPLGVKAHSTRSMVASKAFMAGVPMQDICNAAGWSTPLTFVRFYGLDIQATPGSSVLLPSSYS